MQARSGKLSFGRCQSCCPTSLHSQACRTPRTVRIIPSAGKQLKIAVIGAGVAGVATVWHLLDQGLSSGHQTLHIHLFDAEGIAAGGSGAAAGLLHAYSSTGKVLWRGEEAMLDAVQLVTVAEQHSQSSSGDSVVQHPESSRYPWVWRHGLVRPAVNAKQVAAFKKALAKQNSSPTHVGNQDAATTSATMFNPQPLTAEQLPQLIPGLEVPAAVHLVCNTSVATDQQQPGKLLRRQRRQQTQQQQALQGGTTQHEQEQQSNLAGLLIQDGLVLHPPSYLQALWRACKARVQGIDNGSGVYLHTHWMVRSLQELAAPSSDTDGQPDASASDCTQGGWVESWDAIVVAAGAAVGTINEMQGVLPVQLCQGYTLHMVPQGSPCRTASPALVPSPPPPPPPATAPSPHVPDEGHLQYPPGAPSLLGSPYLAAHGQHNLVVGATRAFGMSPEHALALCQPCKHWIDMDDTAGLPSNNIAPDQPNRQTQQAGTPSSAQDQDPGLEALAPGSSALLQGAGQLWPPVNKWRVLRIRNGVRALPPRTSAGSVPLLGCLPLPPATAPCDGTLQNLPVRKSSMPKIWFIGGLGARGLLYHAMLARLLASAVLADDASLLPAECQAAGMAAAAQGCAPQVSA